MAANFDRNEYNCLSRAMEALSWLDGTHTDDYFFAKAHAYAAIAQAEQLQRIADALEILAHPNRLHAPDPLDYYSEDDYNRAAEKYDYHRNAIPGESIEEYKQRTATALAETLQES